MSQNDDVRFTSSSIKLPLFSPPLHHHTPKNHFFTNLHSINRNSSPQNPILQTLSKFSLPKFHQNFDPRNAILQFFKKPRNIKLFNWNLRRTPLLCSASMSLTQNQAQNNPDDLPGPTQLSGPGPKTGSGNEERVLISEVLVRNKDGEELELKDLESEALNALKACRPNSALTVREVQEDVHRIIDSGYFCSCMPVAVDTRDGIRLVFQVEPNQEFHGLVCEGANVLPARFVEDSFRDGCGKIVNIKRIDEIISSINGWYMERGLFGAVSSVEMLSGGMIRLGVSEAEVNNIAIRFLDKTGEPTVEKTRPETILRQLTTKKGQVYSMLQGKRDVDTVLAMGIMEDVSIIPQPAGDTGKVDLIMNVVERKSGGGISAGGGISSGITNGPLAGLIGSCAIYHKNLFGRNQKLNLSLERGQIDSLFRINYTDPWIEGDDKRTSRSIMIQNSRTPGTLVHNQPDGSLTIGRVTAGIEYSHGIKCAQGQVIVIKIPLKELSGRLSEKIGQFQALRKLSLHDNEIGGAIPISLGFLPNLRGVQLYNNRFSGSIPSSLGLCPLLQTLELSNNSLSGIIPTSLINSTKLYRLNLSYNSLSGEIPPSFTQSSSIIFLDLQYNNLSGSIPDSWGGNGNNIFHLQSLNLDHNSLSGGIPVSFSKLSELLEVSINHNHIIGVIPNDIGRLSRLRFLDFSYNTINGSLPKSLSNLASLVLLNLESNNLDSQIPLDINKLKKLSVLNLRNNQFSGEIPMSIGDLPNLSSFNVSYNNLSGLVPAQLVQKFNSSAFLGNPRLCDHNASTPCHLTPSPITRGSKLSVKDIILMVVGALIIILFLLCCILLCCLIKKRGAAKGGKTSGVKGVPLTAGEIEAAGENGGKLVHFGGPVMFSADDLLCATADILGKSTYGTVYKATLENGNQVAVRRLREKITKGQREFEREVNVLGKISHQNLLALRAYYLGTKGEKLLVFDFMPKGSLATFLHARSPDTPIDWPMRMRIAKGTSRGLLYLHSNANIIHGNLTSSNVLLDENSNAKIADYGLSRLVTATANANVIATAGALGYRAPELTKLKKANVKTDVYSLGVIILELLTGKSPGEAILNGVDLPRKVASTVKEEGTSEVFDLELMRDASIIGDEMLNTLKLALHCVDPSPSARPETQQVLQQLEEIRPEAAAPSASD